MMMKEMDDGRRERKEKSGEKKRKVGGVPNSIGERGE